MKYSERFAGKVAVVTGGCSGIGRAIAKRFVADSGKVVVGDIDTDSFAALTEELGAENCYCVKCDVSVRAEVDAMIQAAYDKFGGFDCMFGIAGINIMKDFLDFTEEENDRIFNVNYKGMFNTTQAAGRAFVAHNTPGRHCQRGFHQRTLRLPQLYLLCCQQGGDSCPDPRRRR